MRKSSLCRGHAHVTPVPVNGLHTWCWYITAMLLGNSSNGNAHTHGYSVSKRKGCAISDTSKVLLNLFRQQYHTPHISRWEWWVDLDDFCCFLFQCLRLFLKSPFGPEGLAYELFEKTSPSQFLMRWFLQIWLHAHNFCIIKKHPYFVKTAWAWLRRAPPGRGCPGDPPNWGSHFPGAAVSHENATLDFPTLLINKNGLPYRCTVFAWI